MPRIKKSRFLDLEKKHPVSKFLPAHISNYHQSLYQILQLTVQRLIKSLCFESMDGVIRLKNPTRSGSFPVTDINLFLWGIAYEYFNYLEKRKIEKAPLEAPLKNFVRSYYGIMESKDFLIRNGIVSEEDFLKAILPLRKFKKKINQNIGTKIPKLETGELETIIYSYFKNFVPSRFTKNLIYESMVIIWNTLELEKESSEEGTLKSDTIRKRINRRNIKAIDIKELKETFLTIKKQAQEEMQAVR